MNIFEPKEDTVEERPLVILAHGGFYITGNKEQFDYLCTSLAKLGFVAVTIDYRKWEGDLRLNAGEIASVSFRAVSDMKAAIRYFRKNMKVGINIT